MIIASHHKEKIIELCELNRNPCYAHSVASYDLDNKGMFSVLRGSGELSYNKLDDDPMFYTIVYLHTTECKRNIQPPSILDDYTEHYLWFNGEITTQEKEKLQIEEDTKKDWNAMLLCRHIVRYGSPVNVDGSFACMYSDGADLYMFRNEKESLFFDDDFNICSMPFVGSRVLLSNKVWKMNMEKKKLKMIEEFDTVRSWV